MDLVDSGAAGELHRDEEVAAPYVILKKPRRVGRHLVAVGAEPIDDFIGTAGQGGGLEGADLFLRDDHPSARVRRCVRRSRACPRTTGGPACPARIALRRVAEAGNGALEKLAKEGIG